MANVPTISLSTRISALLESSSARFLRGRQDFYCDLINQNNKRGRYNKFCMPSPLLGFVALYSFGAIRNSLGPVFKVIF